MSFDRRLNDLEKRFQKATESRGQYQALLEDMSRLFPVERAAGPDSPIVAMTVNGVRFETPEHQLTPHLAVAILEAAEAAVAAQEAEGPPPPEKI